MSRPAISVAYLLVSVSLIAQVPVMPDQFRVNLDPGKKYSGVEFYQQNYRTSTIDLRKIKALESLEIPDSIVITPPDLSRFDHVVVLIGVSGKDESSLVLWLAGNYNYSNITFFLDYDQDRDFTNDRPPLRMKAGDEPREIRLTPKGGDRLLWLAVPEVQVKRIEKYKIRIADQFAIALTAGVGSGKISYQYDDLIIGYPTRYFVKITEKNLGAALSYNAKNFLFGAKGSIQNHYYFTSHLDVQLGEPFRRFDASGIWVLDDNTDNFVNIDEHSTNRFQWSVFGAYRFQVSRTIDIQPIIRYGKTHYFNPEYARFRDQEDHVYPLLVRPFYEIGVRSEFTTGISRGVYFEIARNDYQWEPEGFLHDTPHENFESTSVIWKLNFGYKFAL